MHQWEEQDTHMKLHRYLYIWQVQILHMLQVKLCILMGENLKDKMDKVLQFYICKALFILMKNYKM